MSYEQLAALECVPCKGGVAPLKGEELDGFHNQLAQDWGLVDEHHLEKEFDFEGYQPAVDFTNRVAKVAEAQNHHPDILLRWGKVKVTIWTHKIDGLTASDFYFAAKAEKAY